MTPAATDPQLEPTHDTGKVEDDEGEESDVYEVEVGGTQVFFCDRSLMYFIGRRRRRGRGGR
jgi:hypothetical protein